MLQSRHPQPPLAEKKPFEISIHDDTRIDDYYWLREKENPHTIAYLESENAYLESMMQVTKPLQEQLFQEIKSRIKETDESVPVYKNGYFYYTRSVEGGQYFKYCRKKETLDAEEQILLDVDLLAEGHSYFSVTGFSVSPNNLLMAYGVDDSGRRQYTLMVKNLVTGEIMPDRIFPTDGSAVWANDSRTIFYTETNPGTLLSENIRKHRLGEDSAADELVYHEVDKSNYLGLYKTRSREYIIIHSSSTLSSEVRVLHAGDPDGAFRLFQQRMPHIKYSIEHSGDHFIVLTNWDAVNFRLMSAPLSQTSRENWEEMIPHRPDVLLQGVEPFEKNLVITERREGLLHFRIQDLTTGSSHDLAFDEPAYAAFPGANPEYNTSFFRFTYTSMTTPTTTYDYHILTRERHLLKQQEIPGGYNPKDYVTERLYAPAMDGTAIPISIVYKAGFNKNGLAPLLLYGYGSYGHSIDASFSIARLSLLDRGFAFAMAHVRGGQEMGRLWYEDGKLLHKKNTFTDFIRCGEYLVGEKFTSPQHLYALGGSAGGLLIGAVANLRPDLWNGLIASVPFVDVVTTMLDETIPLTTNEFDEWGNPKERTYYDYMKSYSPYDNVHGNYPNLLVTTGLHDSQVQYYEPAKWVAKIRAHKVNDTRLLFHTNMVAGHGGASGRFKYLKEIAMQYSFLLALENKWKL